MKQHQCNLNIFFFNDTATTEIYTLSLHDALPISGPYLAPSVDAVAEIKVLLSNYQAEYGRSSGGTINTIIKSGGRALHGRSEEHTSELQSLRHLVCRLLLEKKKKNIE